ncbi:glycosyltransferase [Nitratidesulfovibrio sp. 1201_IL3209]|uniref:glycosyltransferase n=1 Tax=Nitratidesulfovibrio sp. 1201_IL3209 TaxID=3084053 RepID=UPI002FD94396
MTRDPRQQETVAQQTAKLEEAVRAAIERGDRSPRLYDAVLDALCAGVDSPVFSQWVMDFLMAGAAIQPPSGLPPVATIIVPCHNYGEYLEECINSVLMQTFTAWELIIINDGSTDNTHEVAQELLRRHPDYAIRYFRQERRGIVQPRNRGATLARGEFILALDADDLIAPQFLEKTVAALRVRPDLGYMSTKALFFGSVNAIWPTTPFNWVNLLVTNQQTNTTLYRKRMWREIGGYEERMVHGYMDWEFWIRATRHGWAGAQLDEPLFFYRRKANSVVMRAKERDVAIKEQIVRLHPDVYDVSKLDAVRAEMHNQNWIPVTLVRQDLVIRPRGPVDMEDTAATQERAKALLEMLRNALPSLAYAFEGEHAGRGDPAVYPALQARLTQKARHLADRGERDKAVETALQLLAAFPAQPGAALLAMQVLMRCARIHEAHTLARQYMALFPRDRAVRGFTADLLGMIGSCTEDPYRAMALLDCAHMLAPDHEQHVGELAARLAALGQDRTEERLRKGARTADARRRVWYVTDTFGFGAGGVNGVTQAKFMTLSSILRGHDEPDGSGGPDVTVVTAWHPGLPEAMAEFARMTADVCGDNGFRWPLWIAVHPERNPGEDPRWKAAGEPELIIEEGVLLEGHRFLRTLPLPEDCPRTFVHHTSPDQYTGKFEYRNLYDEAIHAFTRYENHVCVSENVIAEWKAIEPLSGKRWTYIPNCAAEEEAAALLRRDTGEVRDALELPRDAMIYLCLASVQTRKGHDILLEQMAEVFHKVPRAVLVCVGPVHGEWSGWDIVAEARRRYGTERVRFTGIRRNALDYVRACDCMVLPSREEALPLVLLEGMALEKPCVASNVNGIPELVVHGETGLLFPLESPRDLARYMTALGTDPELARTMGQRAGERYREHFSRKRHTTRWTRAIQDMLAGAQP